MGNDGLNLVWVSDYNRFVAARERAEGGMGKRLSGLIDNEQSKGRMSIVGSDRDIAEQIVN